MFRYAWLPVVISVSGCASMQDTLCDLIEPDSYVLTSVVRCQTMQVSIDYDKQVDFAALTSYAWIQSQPVRSANAAVEADSQLRQWVTDAVDAQLADKGFKLDQAAPDFLASYASPFDKRGTLTLTFVRADNRHSIWRGKTTDQAHLARNMAAWKTRIRTAVNLLLEEFPPIREK